MGGACSALGAMCAEALMRRKAWPTPRAQARALPVLRSRAPDNHIPRPWEETSELFGSRIF